MGSIIKRKKRGPHTVTQNTRTGKITVSTSTRAGNVRTTRSISNGKTRTTQTTHFGDGLFSRTVKTTGGSGRKSGGGSNWLSGLKGTTNENYNSSEEKESKPTVKLSTTAKVVWILIVMSVGIPLALWSKWIGVIFMAIMILPIASDSNE